MRTCVTLCCTFLISALAFGQHDIPKRGYVPDSATAVKIAEAVLIPVYGEKQIESERPFTAKLKDNVWTVYGSLHCPDGKGGTTTCCNGGVAEVQISKVDAHILSLIHYK
jgi:hypothetical protein